MEGARIRSLAIISAAFVLLAAPAAAGVLESSAATQSHSYRFHVALKLKEGLRGTPLARHAFKLEAEGWRWNINPFFVAAVAGTESSFGAAACGGNAWGLGNCGIAFTSLADGIGYATKLLRTSYLDDGLRTLEHVGGRYAACGSCWAERTEFFMRERFGSPLMLTYPSLTSFAVLPAWETPLTRGKGA
jgi:hypothetical protein